MLRADDLGDRRQPPSLNCSRKGEPRLGKRGLYGSTAGRHPQIRERAAVGAEPGRWHNDLVAIARTLGTIVRPFGRGGRRA